MWPSTTAFGSFENIACPAGASCELPYCIFAHEAAVVQSTNAVAASKTAPLEPATKRLKLDDGGSRPVSLSDGASSLITKPQVFTGSIAPKKASTERTENGSTSTPHAPKVVNVKAGDILPRTATKPVSPPPKKADAGAPLKLEEEVPLNPRKLPKDPAPYARRLTMIKLLHEYMSPFNDKVAKAVSPEVKALHLSANQLRKVAVEEEEKAAKENFPVYENVLKQRLATLKKMNLLDWVKDRRSTIAKEKGDPPKKVPPKKIDTGLTPNQEVIYLSELAAPHDILSKHDILMKPHTETELEKSRSAQVSADFWEECDRCKTRFQVFPDRREEDGALTTGGTCQHHWGRRVFAKKTKGEAPDPTRLSCCNDVVGSPGCTTHDTHVFKISDTRRLSLVMPFIETPENDKAKPHTAVCFDCEMGYTTYGLELLRLTAVAWPSYRPLVDVLVRPLGQVLDLNTRFSGVTPEQFFNAKPYDPQNPRPMRKDLRIVDSPYVARDLFLEHVAPTTPVCGHAIENDLNVIRLIHPTIVDTVILYPANRLPFRNGLKKLAKLHLDLDIQQGGAAGHDSYEDAKTTGELIRFKIASDWKRKKEDGWTITDEGVFPPMPSSTPPPVASPVPSMTGIPNVVPEGGSKAQKRKFVLVDEGVSDEPPTKRQH
ncbi:hypothetical protein K458DRAFT_201243 [Lentithecium fluviatile CBS 122367]|uniref:Exonuclease domain-containing protein n=1 Tax=Lentithecium fluviatile CBS 122367 TaxID=1168545 RepID=A0A6G1J960_9PLEO|nr:hypothetical protein K458DRAFT_201243 [Lentithecium fluviatile CBS 122367]